MKFLVSNKFSSFISSAIILVIFSGCVTDQPNESSLPKNSNSKLQEITILLETIETEKKLIARKNLEFQHASNLSKEIFNNTDASTPLNSAEKLVCGLSKQKVARTYSCRAALAEKKRKLASVQASCSEIIYLAKRRIQAAKSKINYLRLKSD